MAKYGVNKVILVGNLGRDPEVKHLESGVAVATFSLATTERFRDREGNYGDRTEWHNIVMWRGLAETASKYLKKGSTIYVSGRLTTRSWEGQDGKKNYMTEIVADEMLMLDSRGNFGEGGSGSFNENQQSYGQNQNFNKPAEQPVQQPKNYTSGNDIDMSQEEEDDLPF